MTDESPRTSRWLRRLQGGDEQALARLFDRYRPRLRKLVGLRLDARLAARLDPSDVLQEVFLDMAGQIHGYLRRPRVAFYVWLRGLAWQRLLKVHRRHLGAGCRDAGRELPLPAASSAALARRFVDPRPDPESALFREELRRRVQDALARLEPEDREVILMRDFEDLSNNDVAQVLGLTASAATMRYGRALHRLKKQLEAEGASGGSQP